jgi:hypothetical protein
MLKIKRIIKSFMIWIKNLFAYEDLYPPLRIIHVCCMCGDAVVETIYASLYSMPLRIKAEGFVKIPIGIRGDRLFYFCSKHTSAEIKRLLDDPEFIERIERKQGEQNVEN